jgi:hypothetical protein
MTGAVIQPDISGEFVGHILLDVPAEHPTFKFEKIAQALATIVQASEPQFAVGIFGGWGSGKSTLMNEIERQVEESKQAIVVTFNAWRYEREPHLIVPLLDTIRASLSEWADDTDHLDDQRKQIKSIAGRIGRVVRALVRATSVEIGLPGTAVISVDPGQALDEMSSAHDPATNPQSLYYAAFQELNAAFTDVNSAGPSRIIVFVDDLDRCLPERALTVLESMKLFFDIPGFIFIVGLDERVVQSAVRTKLAIQPDGERDRDRQIEREYLNKMFQVPFTLPEMEAGQLKDLLKWLEDNGHLGAVQKQDLRKRVEKYLHHVAKEGINPREVKRYINAYTLHRMIRPDLNPNMVLALQTLDFRRDWERFYEDVVLAEPDVFAEVLGRFRSESEDTAFEDVWPEIGMLPLELSNFLRSNEVAELANADDVERYVSLLETTRSTHPWVKDAMRYVGLLRRHVRAVSPSLQFGSDDARAIGAEDMDVLGHLKSSFSALTPGSAGRLESSLEKLRSQFQLLAPPSPTEIETTDEQVEEWKKQAAAHIDVLQQELRLIRRRVGFGAS